MQTASGPSGTAIQLLVSDASEQAACVCKALLTLAGAAAACAPSSALSSVLAAKRALALSASAVAGRSLPVALQLSGNPCTLNGQVAELIGLCLDGLLVHVLRGLEFEEVPLQPVALHLKLSQPIPQLLGLVRGLKVAAAEAQANAHATTDASPTGEAPSAAHTPTSAALTHALTSPSQATRWTRTGTGSRAHACATVSTEARAGLWGRICWSLRCLGSLYGRHKDQTGEQQHAG